MTPQEIPVLPGVSVVLVNFHTPEAIDSALDVLLPGAGLDLEVLVVDQEPSPEESAHHARWQSRGCRVLPSPTNLGFAGGCNLGADQARHPWLLFLNSDAWMTQEHVGILLRAAVDGGAVAAGPLSNRASDVQTLYTWDATRRFRTPEQYLGYRYPVQDPPFAYHRLSGVCLLVRRDEFDAVGRFERSYGLGYFEDDELTIRLARRGPLLVVPQAFVYHQGGLSWRSSGRHERSLAMTINRLRYLYRNTTSLLEPRDQGPLVTIVITTFSRPGLLREALASVARQTYRPLEVVVVDDAGTDVTEVVEQVTAGSGLLVQHLVNERNLGKPASINRALEVCSGELIGYLDDDDELLPDHALAAVNALEVEPALDAVYFASISRKVDGEGATLHRQLVSNEWDVLRLLEVNLLPNCALVHRRELLDRVGLHRELEVLEDWDFLRRASLVARVLHVPLVTSTFRVRSDGDSRNGLIKRSFSSYLATERQLRLGAPPLDAAPAAVPAVWQQLVQDGIEDDVLDPNHRPHVGVAADRGLSPESLRALRPDVFSTHLTGEVTVERAYAGLLAAARPRQQIAALSALIELYLEQGNVGAAGRLHGFLSWTLSGSELSGSGNAVETGRRIYEQEGLRGLRELSVLSARRRASLLGRRLRGA